MVLSSLRPPRLPGNQHYSVLQRVWTLAVAGADTFQCLSYLFFLVSITAGAIACDMPITVFTSSPRFKFK